MYLVQNANRSLCYQSSHFLEPELRRFPLWAQGSRNSNPVQVGDFSRKVRYSQYADAITMDTIWCKIALFPLQRADYAWLSGYTDRTPANMDSVIQSVVGISLV